MKEMVTDIEKLREIALDQHGYITTSQAEEAGVSRPSLTYLTKNKRIERASHGIYRIPQIPSTQYDAMHLALLWSGSKDAVLSHDTALAAWEASDINPTKIHLTIPKGRRINKAGGSNIIIYHENIEKQQIGWWEQMPTVKLPLAVQQCIDRGTPSHIILQAIKNGRARGMISQEESNRLHTRLDSRNEQ